jgi:hypothetical protein
MDENNSSRQSTNSDYFILIGGFAFILLVAVASIRWVPQATTIASFACSMLAAIIIYRFLGGFSKEDSFAVGSIKVTGALCALLATYLTVNPSLEGFINRLVPEPAGYENFLVIDGDGKMQNLEVKLQGREDIKPITIEPNKEQLNKFVEACLSRPGVCIPEPKPVKIEVMNELDQGKAKVCENRVNYLGLPISLSKGDDNYVSVRIQYDKVSCDDHDAALKLKISCVDYKELTKVPTTEAITYQLGPFRTPSDAPLKSRKTTC